MEEIKQQSENPNISEQKKGPEYFKFAKDIEESVVNIFPFQEGNQKKKFIDNLNSVLENDSDLSEDEFIKKIRLSLVTLNNSHTMLIEKEHNDFMLEKSIFYKAGKFWVKNNKENVEVIKVNEVSVDKWIEDTIKETGGGTNEGKINRALGYLNYSNTASTLTVEVIDEENNVKKMDVNFVNRKDGLQLVKEKDIVSGKMLDSAVGYLKVTSWNRYTKIDNKNIADLVEEELKNVAGCKTLIIDVRGNDGGSSTLAEKLAGHFVKEPVVYGTSSGKEQAYNEVSKPKLYLQPQNGFLDKKVIILTSLRCFSSNEMFIMMLKDTGNAVTIGQTTGGGSGNPTSIELKFGEKDYTLRVTTRLLIRNNGKPLEGFGIEPDVPVIIMPEDVRKNHDIDLETALDYAHNQ